MLHSFPDSSFPSLKKLKNGGGNVLTGQKVKPSLITA